jgi:multidrug efflux pump subunit AcrA (membrane-fusion protein)
MVISTFKIFEELSQTLDPATARKLAGILDAFYADLQQTVTKAEFSELRLALRELAEAQKRTELRVEELALAQQRTEARIEELAAAQQRTEARIGELAAAQQRTEARIGELAAAQQRTEARIGELLEAQKGAEVRVGGLEAALVDLAKAQRQTDIRVGELALALNETNRQLGGLTATVGYGLENEAYRWLPALLARDHGLKVQGRLRRDFVRSVSGGPIEVNILGEAVDAQGRRRRIVGESKAQLSIKDIERFLRLRVDPFRSGPEELFPIVVAHMVSQPETMERAREKGVAVYLSYEFGPPPAGD